MEFGRDNKTRWKRQPNEKKCVKRIKGVLSAPDGTEFMFVRAILSANVESMARDADLIIIAFS